MAFAAIVAAAVFAAQIDSGPNSIPSGPPLRITIPAPRGRGGMGRRVRARRVVKCVAPLLPEPIARRPHGQHVHVAHLLAIRIPIAHHIRSPSDAARCLSEHLIDASRVVSVTTDAINAQTIEGIVSVWAAKAAAVEVKPRREERACVRCLLVTFPAPFVSCLALVGLNGAARRGP